MEKRVGFVDVLYVQLLHSYAMLCYAMRCDAIYNIIYMMRFRNML